MKEFRTNRIKLITPDFKYLKDFHEYASKPNIGPMAGGCHMIIYLLPNMS